MARVKKIDNSIRKRLLQQSIREKRKFQSRISRQRILIVCEGERTEPNYFEGYSTILPKGIVNLEIIGTGYNTINVVESAITEVQLKKGTIEEYDQAWAVFDKDDFPDENFNSAIILASRNKIGYAYSNEAFELWYVLHFQFLDTAISRHQYIEILHEQLGHTYFKQDPRIFFELQTNGSQENAIKWAKRLLREKSIGNPAREIPTTTVFRLVEKLNKFIEN